MQSLGQELNELMLDVQMPSKDKADIVLALHVCDELLFCVSHELNPNYD